VAKPAARRERAISISYSFPSQYRTVSGMKTKKASGIWSSVDSTGPENQQIMPENVPPPPPPPPPNSPFFKRGHRRPRNGSKTKEAGDDCSQQQLNTSFSSDNYSADDRPAVVGISESMGSFEVEAGTGDSASFTSWKNRLKWLQGRNNSILSQQQQHQQGDNDDNNDNAHTFYYSGGPMNVDGVMKTIDNNRQEPDPETTPSRNYQLHDHNNDHNNPCRTPAYPLRKQATSSFSRVASWFTGRNNSELGDNDSLASFDEAEWTPPDSSYGAAIPVGGWIPKPIRRTIEGTLIALGTLMLVYMVVTTSMRVTNERNRSKQNDGGGSSVDSSYMDYKSNNGNYAPQNDYDDKYYGGVYLDDDRYVAYDKNDYAEGEDEEEDEDEGDGAEDEQDGDYANEDEQGDGNADGGGGR